MPRQRSPERDAAKKIFIEKGGDITNREIAKILDINEKTISVWKSRDEWNNEVQQKPGNRRTTKKKKKRGAPKGNKNATGNKSGLQRITHGFYSKYLPAETLDIFNAIEDIDPIDILWANIKLQYTAIIRSLKIMHVDDKDDITKTLSVDGTDYTAYNIQYAWDKQANALVAQSKAMATLQNMIKRYDELMKSEISTEEQRLRIEKLKIEVSDLKGDSDIVEEDNFIDALNIKAGEVWSEQ